MGWWRRKGSKLDSVERFNEIDGHCAVCNSGANKASGESPPFITWPENSKRQSVGTLTEESVDEIMATN